MTSKPANRRCLKNGVPPRSLDNVTHSLKHLRTSATSRSSRWPAVLLAANLIALFRVDPDWAKEHVIPLFDWNGPELEARAAWEGFLWSPRLYRPLTETLKQAFLDTAKHYAKLGKHRRQYAAVLTFVALDPGDIFKPAELAQATRALPQEGLADAAEALARSGEAAGGFLEEQGMAVFAQGLAANERSDIQLRSREPCARVRGISG